MILCVEAKATMPGLYIDYIETRLRDGREISLNWDESEVSYDPDTKKYSAKYRGVYFDEEYANGRIAELCGMQIAEIQTYSRNEDKEYPEGAGITISRVEFLDGNKMLTIDFPEPGGDRQRKVPFGEFRNVLERGAAEAGVKLEARSPGDAGAARLVAGKGLARDTKAAPVTDARSASDLLDWFRKEGLYMDSQKLFGKSSWGEVLACYGNEEILQRIFGE